LGLYKKKKERRRRLIRQGVYALLIRLKQIDTKRKKKGKRKREKRNSRHRKKRKKKGRKRERLATYVHQRIFFLLCDT